MDRIEDVLSAVDRFQDAAQQADGFSSALSSLADSLGADCATLEMIDRNSGAAPLFAEARVDPDSVADYLNHYQAISPRVLYGLSDNAKPVAHDADVLDPDAMVRDPFYAEFLADYDLGYFLSIAVDPTADVFSVVSFQFHRRHGFVEPEKIRLSEAIRPLMQRAMRGYWRENLAAGPDPIKADMVAQLGLTPAEASLALSLLMGRTVGEHSDLVAISRNTAYTHYARLKQKLGCSKQAEVLTWLHRRYPLASRASFH